VKAGATAIPATNVIGNTGAAVTFGAVGGGNGTNLSGANSGSLSWSHTVASTDLIVLVFINYNVNGASYVTTSSNVTYGGAAMTQFAQQRSSFTSGGYCITEGWFLKTPASGTQTVNASVTGTNLGSFAGNSVSYLASKIAAYGVNTGGGSTTLSESSASATGRMVVGVFGQAFGFSSPTVSGYTQTQRYNGTFGVVIGDAPGASSVAFGLTATNTNIQWCGITADLSN
jgi:hypothetical protein